MNWGVASCTGVYLLVWVTLLWVYRWRNPRCNGRLPPGSMGLPLLGETLQFFSPSATLEVSPFVRHRMQRYGPIFKTCLVGQPAVVSADPELNHFVFQQEGRLFQSWYPQTFRNVFGRRNVGSTQGILHKYLKSLVLKLVGPESLKGELFYLVQDAACTSLSSWSQQPTVDLKDAIATMIFNLTSKKLISYDPSSETSENLKENFAAFMKGLISFPINLPGTAYSECMKGRKQVMAVLKRMLKERQSTPERRGNLDFFDLVIEEMKKEGTDLTEESALDLVFSLLFAIFETTAVTLTIAIKLLTEHPTVLR